MKQQQRLFFITGGLLLLTSATAFLYFTLFRYDATLIQWVSAIMIFILGVASVSVGNEL